MTIDILDALNVITFISSIASIYFSMVVLKELKSLSSQEENVDAKSKPEIHLAERLHELQTMKFSDMSNGRRIK